MSRETTKIAPRKKDITENSLDEPKKSKPGIHETGTLNFKYFDLEHIDCGLVYRDIRDYEGNIDKTIKHIPREGLDSKKLVLLLFYYIIKNIITDTLNKYILISIVCRSETFNSDYYYVKYLCEMFKKIGIEVTIYLFFENAKYRKVGSEFPIFTFPIENLETVVKTNVYYSDRDLRDGKMNLTREFEEDAMVERKGDHILLSMVIPDFKISPYKYMLKLTSILKDHSDDYENLLKKGKITDGLLVSSLISPIWYTDEETPKPLGGGNSIVGAILKVPNFLESLSTYFGNFIRTADSRIIVYQANERSGPLRENTYNPVYSLNILTSIIGQDYTSPFNDKTINYQNAYRMAISIMIANLFLQHGKIDHKDYVNTVYSISDKFNTTNTTRRIRVKYQNHFGQTDLEKSGIGDGDWRRSFK